MSSTLKICSPQRTTCRIPRRGLATQRHKPHRLATAIILNRSPLLTPKPTPFEQAFYDYQARIHRAIQNPFPYEFYFKAGSVLEARFKAEERAREQTAFGPGFGGKDELDTSLLTDESEQQQDHVMSRRVGNDEKNLDRRGPRNLYLLVKSASTGQHVWRFPQGEVQKSELLHEAAQRDLAEECGTAMNTWIVGRRPIGFYKYDYSKSAEGRYAGDNVFFFKAHIFAGQVKPDGKNIVDFAWLTKEEIESRVDREYWLGTRDMLSDS